MKNYGRYMREKNQKNSLETAVGFIAFGAAFIGTLIVGNAVCSELKNKKKTTDNMDDMDVEDDFVDQDLEDEF